jgi:hypothetical protein
LLRDSINQSTEKNQSGQICNNKLANAATPSIVYCCTSLFVKSTFWQFWNVNLAQRRMCKSMWMQALDTIVPFYAVLLASAQLLQCLSSPTYLPSHPTSACQSLSCRRGCDGLWWAGWFVPWCGFSSCPTSEGCQPSLNPSRYFITVNLVIFIFGQWQPHFSCK